MANQGVRLRTVISGGDIVTPNEVIPSGYLVIEGGKISSVDKTRPQISTNDLNINAEGFGSPQV